jgi:sialate O-acetylesterase
MVIYYQPALCGAIFAVATTAAAPAWELSADSYCDDKVSPVTWYGTFDACYQSCAVLGPNCTQFAYTNTNWAQQAAKPGCSLAPPCATRCTAGDCTNWDTYTCRGAGGAGSCSVPAGPPVPVTFSPALGSHMVIQRSEPARIWGKANAGAVVRVALGGGCGAAAGGDSCSATADALGDWQCDLAARPGCATPATITASSTSAALATAVLEDVLFGEVWGCHGQSNMQFGLGQDINATAECAAAGRFGQLLRLMTFTQGKPWAVATPAEACTGTGFAPFSAVCWYFGASLLEALGGAVPVGLVSSNVGGTSVERWSSPDATARCNQTGVVQQGNLWAPYIVPLLNMAVAGWTWYQGESNVACSTSWKWMPGLNCGIGCTAAKPVCDADVGACADFYSCQFPAMIADWRAKWRPRTPTAATTAKPFLFVQLAPYTEGVGQPGDISTAVLREAQTAALALPRVAMASAVDWGDTASPLGNIHPRYKRVVGERLALAALALAYSNSSSSSSSSSSAPTFAGPTLLSATLSGVPQQPPPLATLLLTFDAPVVLRAPPEGACPVAAASCAWLALDGANATTIAAHPTDPNSLFVSANTPSPTLKEVRYLFGDWPVPTIYGLTGLPAAPFRTAVTQ